MISKHYPTAAQKRWQEWLRAQGCAICGNSTQLHHAIGSAGSHNKVSIGQWWVINLCPAHHTVPHGIHGDLSAFDDFDKLQLGTSRKLIEKSLFELYSELYTRETGEQIPTEVKSAIMGYHK